MFGCCWCCVLSGRGLCDELITLTEKFYRLWCVVRDLETSRMRRLWPALGRSATEKKNHLSLVTDIWQRVCRRPTDEPTGNGKWCLSDKIKTLSIPFHIRRELFECSFVFLQNGATTSKGSSGDYLQLLEAHHSLYKASWWAQLRAVLWRSWISIIKEPLLMKMRLFQTLVSSTSADAISGSVACIVESRCSWK
jgi:hypothetical protein